MTFLQLALVNASRNIGRTTLSVIVMAVAAMVMTASVSVAAGYPREGYAVQKAFFGGDIIIYPDQYRLSGPEVTGDETVTYARVAADAQNDLRMLHPELRADGYVRSGPSLPNVIDLRQVQQRLWDDKNVRLIYPYYALPGLRTTESGQTITSPLRGRNTLLDGSVLHLYEYVTAGRYFVSGDDGEYVAVVDAAQAGEGRPVPAVGSSIEVRVPAVRHDPDGDRWYDYGTMRTFRFQVIGQIELPTRIVSWWVEPRRPMTEQLYWSTPQVFIPAATFEAIYREVAGGNDYEFEQLAVILEDQSYINRAMAALRRALPEYTAVTVAEQVEMAAARGLPERPHRAPPGLYGDTARRTQVGVPLDLGPALNVLLYLIAGTIVAANMLLLVASRRREMGILRAVGARAREVSLMIVGETCLVSLGGALIGFALVRVAATWNLISNRVGLARVGLITLADLGRVLGLTLGLALVFGLLPAVTMGRVAPMEVLRHD